MTPENAHDGDVWILTTHHGTRIPTIYHNGAFRGPHGAWHPNNIATAQRIWPEEP